MQAQPLRRSGHQRAVARPRLRHRPSLAAAAVSVKTSLVLAGCATPPPPAPPELPASSTKAGSKGRTPLDASQVSLASAVHTYCLAYRSELEATWTSAALRSSGWSHPDLKRLARLMAHLDGDDD